MIPTSTAAGLMHQSLGNSDAWGWVCRAANAGYPQAQLQLGHWYNEDRNREDLWPFISLRPDNRKAYVWYSLAADNGNLFAAQLRDRLARNDMTAEQVAAARERLARWSPGSCGILSTARSARPATPADPR